MVPVDTTVDGVSIDLNGFAFKKVNDMVKSQIDYITVHTPYINDFTVGSITRTLIESESIELEKLYYYTLENLQQAIEEGLTSAFGFTRRKAKKAYGKVVINLVSSLSNDIIINRGTKFYSTLPNYEQVYETLSSYTIPKGSMSFTIPVYCTVAGVYGNVPANTINKTTELSGIATVTNPQEFTTGQDSETREQAQIRFREMIQAIAKGTNQSLRYAAMTIPEITGVYEYESTYGTVLLFCHDGNGDLSAQLAQKVADVIEEYRPAGIKVLVLPVHKSYATLNIGVQVGYSALNSDAFLNKISRKVQNYINSFSVGDNLYISDIVQKIMDISDDGIVDAKVKLKVYPDDMVLQYSPFTDDTTINVKGTLVNHPYLNPIDFTSPEHYGVLDYKIDRVNFEQTNGNSWKDAILVKADGTKTIDRAVDVVDVYRTATNELLRVGDINVNFFEANELSDNVTIRRTEVFYQISNSKTVRPDGEWSSSYVYPTVNNPYLWTKTNINYTDGNTQTLYSVVSED